MFDHKYCHEAYFVTRQCKFIFILHIIVLSQ